MEKNSVLHISTSMYSDLLINFSNINC